MGPGSVAGAPPAAVRALRGDVLVPALIVLFFLSGATALVYQSLWLRLLGLVFGVTTYAAGTVLASFFAGLALGSLVAGRLVDRVPRPLWWYGVAEILIGVSALASPVLLDALQAVYVELAPSLGSGPPLTAARFVLSFAVLLVPTTLMGASLPLVLKSSALRRGQVGRSGGLLYATNTAGAILGTMLAGFVLIGQAGIRASFVLAALLNVFIGVAAIVLARSREAGDGDAPAAVAAPAAATAPSAGLTPAARRTVLAVFGLSGLASLALEVVWFRMLVLYLGVTTYAFSIMLATVLAGIAAGSFVISPLLDRRADWLRWLAVTELAIGVLSILSLVALANVYDVLGPAGADVSIEGVAMPAALMFLMAALTMLPASLLLGVAFPIGLRLWTDGRRPQEAGDAVGRFYSVNVFGGILGAVLAAFVLVPALGTRGSLVVAAAVSVAGGLALLAAGGRRGPGAPATAAAGLAAFALAVVAAPDPLSALAERRQPGERVLMRDEGVQTTVAVQERADGMRVLYLDGLHQSNDSPPQVAIHRSIGQLPAALHPDPQRALVVGLGAGTTAGGVAAAAPRAEVDVVELSRGVVRAAEHFRRVNQDVLRRPNVRMRVDDGRNWMLLADHDYDVITADIILPFHAGAGNVYSVDYFRLARRSLDEDGIMLQWVGAQDQRQYELIMRTFLEVFPDATLWGNGTLMVGTKRPLKVSRAAFERRLADPAARAALAEGGLGSYEALLGTYTASAAEMRRAVGEGPILSDDRPRIEFFRSLGGRSEPIDLTSVERGDPRRVAAP